MVALISKDVNALLDETFEARDTGSAEYHYLLGVRLWGDCLRDEAIAALDAALRAQPDHAGALSMGAHILGLSGKRTPAIEFYRRALVIDPDRRIVWSNLGKLLFEERRFREAQEAFQQALRIAPDEADDWNNYAAVLRELGDLQRSAEAADRALRLLPNFPEAALNLGNALLKQDKVEEALVAYERAVNLTPRFGLAHCGRALALSALSRFDDALEAFSEAERLGCVEATAGKGCLELRLGDFAAGWEGYEARWVDGKSLEEALGTRYRRWLGPNDAARRVLVINDHGFGDTIQFCRYLPLMEMLGIEVTFLCPSALHRLMSPLRARLVSDFPSSETFDAQIPISSLPRAFGATLERQIPKAPYLFPEPALCARWTRRIGAHGFKIGVVWQGNKDPKADMARSFPLRLLEPLSQLPNARVISLQKGFGTEQIADLPADFRIESFTQEMDQGSDAFTDTAAIIMQMDVVVCCDTSVAHLAGALGRPVWVMLKADAEWRWLLRRQDSPWYPSMRLFRQQMRGDWEDVVRRVAEAALPLANQKGEAQTIYIPSAAGEVIDKITILEIKERHVNDREQLSNVRKELSLLTNIATSSTFLHPEIMKLRAELGEVNQRLWEIEDSIRAHETRGDFGDSFVELARAIYKNNDRRAAIKKNINIRLRSAIVEEKSYVSDGSSRF